MRDYNWWFEFITLMWMVTGVVLAQVLVLALILNLLGVLK